MKKRLDHLPAGKRHELKFVVDVVREGFAQAIAHRTAAPFARFGRPSWTTPSQ